MRRRSECPECGGFQTEAVHVEWGFDSLEEVRLCDDCPLQYVNTYELISSGVEEVFGNE